MIINNILEILKKNIILFFLSFIFFTFTTYLLIEYQENKTENMYVSSIKIFEDYDNTIAINHIIEKFKTHNRILEESINLIKSANKTYNTGQDADNIIINTDNVLITYGIRTSEIELNNFKTNYITLLFKELNSIGSELDFENEYGNFIQKYFKENAFDVDYFFNYKKHINIEYNKDLNYITFDKLNTNHNEFINISLFMVEISSYKILKNFYKNLYLSYEIFLEDFNNLLFIDQKSLSSKTKNNLMSNYNPNNLRKFIDNEPLQKFSHQFVNDKESFQSTIIITQPNITFIMLFGFIMSLAIIYIKEKYINN